MYEDNFVPSINLTMLQATVTEKIDPTTANNLFGVGMGGHRTPGSELGLAGGGRTFFHGVL